MRLHNLAVKDILKKRVSRTNQYYQQFSTPEAQNPFSSVTAKQIPFEQVLEKIISLDPVQNSQICDLSWQQRFAVIDFISQKQCISFNRNTMAELISIYKYSSMQDIKICQNSKIEKNYYILSGNLSLFQHSKDEEEEEDFVFETQSKRQGKKNEAIKTFSQFQSLGPLFKKRIQTKNVYLIAEPNSIVVEFKNPELQTMLLNHGGMDQEKKAKILQCFPFFSTVGKRIQLILPYIQLKNFTKNQRIYNIHQSPQAFYLIIKGEVIFEMKVKASHNHKKTIHNDMIIENKNKVQNYTVFHTQTFGPKNYFGEEEILANSLRTQTSICYSAQCQLLEIPIDKFLKILSWGDFKDELEQHSKIRISKRQEKVEKALEILQRKKKHKSQHNMEESSFENSSSHNMQNSRRRKKTLQSPKIMHGNVLKRVRANRTEDVNFSMLKANPDMYDTTMRKFRKFNMKPLEKYKPNVNWNLKRVWKVLNLQHILREDAELVSPEGRKYYQNHIRFQNHVNQVKSLRPKTSSSTYRTKLQYIAYLQQFNH